MSNFRLIDRDTGFLMPPLVDEWLPERPPSPVRGGGDRGAGFAGDDRQLLWLG